MALYCSDASKTGLHRLRRAPFLHSITPAHRFAQMSSSRDSSGRGLPRQIELWLINSLLDTMPSSPSQSAEDYLERIHELIEEKGYARVVDIASSLQVKQASVTSMVQKLGEMGYLNYEKYRGLILTQKGRTVACVVKKRHETLSRFFSLLDLDSETQKRDIEGIEHHLSPETVDVLADLAQFFESFPETLQQFLESRKDLARENE